VTLRHGNRIRQTGGKQIAGEVQDLDVREPAASRERTAAFDQADAAAIETLPELLADPDDRRRVLTLLERVLSDPRVRARMSPAQTSTLLCIRALITSTGALDMQARPRPGPQDGAIMAPHAAGAQL